MKGSIIKWSIILLLLAVGGVGFTLWQRVDGRVKKLLLPHATMYAGYTDVPEKTQGVVVEPFTINGWDGGEVQVCLVRRDEDEANLTPIQYALRDRLTGVALDDLRQVDYVLVCADWDHGIRSALPLAEGLAAAGLTCVLWEPRGSRSRRPWCTHGLQESRDVAHIIDALEQRSGRKGLMVVGVGRGFGAELLLQAAAAEPRLRATVSIDAAASLTKTLKRAKVSTPMRELIGMRMNMLTGLEPFDIAAVKSAGIIPREVPVMLVHTGEQESTMEDAVAIYTQLKSDMGRLITPRIPDDAPDATTRTIIYSPEGGTHEVLQRIDVELTRDTEEVPVEILRWLNSCIRPLQEAPLPTIRPDR